jgi:hypothetical protein
MTFDLLEQPLTTEVGEQTFQVPGRDGSRMCLQGLFSRARYYVIEINGGADPESEKGYRLIYVGNSQESR